MKSLKSERRVAWPAAVYVNTITAFVAALVVSGVATPAAAETIINIDFQEPGDVTHDLANGVFSSPGGVEWNGISFETYDLGDLLVDQFDNETDLSLDLGSFGNDAPDNDYTNTLQNSGTFSGFRLLGLPNLPIDAAVYMDRNSGFGFKADLVDTFIVNTGVPTGNLPGVQNNDYVLLSDVLGAAPSPYEIAPGEYAMDFGFEGQLDGFFHGVQIKLPDTPPPFVDSSVRANWDMEINNPAEPTNPLFSDGEVEGGISTGFIESLEFTGTVPSTITRTEATAGVNPFGGGSLGVQAEIDQIGDQGTTKPSGGTAYAEAAFTSTFFPLGPDNTPIDVDQNFVIDGFMDLVGLEDNAQSGDDVEASATVSIFASIRSETNAEVVLFDGELTFYGFNFDADGDAFDWDLNEELERTIFFDGTDPIGGRLAVDFQTVFDDVFTVMNNELIELNFEISTEVFVAEDHEAVQQALSDFFRTLSGTPSSSSPGVTFQNVPEPTAMLMLLASLGLARRRTRRA